MMRTAVAEPPHLRRYGRTRPPRAAHPCAAGGLRCGGAGIPYRGIAHPVRPARRTAAAEPPHLRRSGRYAPCAGGKVPRVAGSHTLCDPLGERRWRTHRTFAAPGATRPARAASFLMSRDRTSCATRSANGGGKAAAPSPLRALRALRGRHIPVPRCGFVAAARGFRIAGAHVPGRDAASAGLPNRFLIRPWLGCRARTWRQAGKRRGRGYR
jgi:hypothetical protein